MSRLYEDDYADEVDDYDYEEEGDGTSAEDQARMRQGVAQVREVLGEGAKSVTQQQIEDALWHYYYDVDKSVNYLLNKFIAPPQKTPKKVAKKANEDGPSLPCDPPTDDERRNARFGYRQIPWGKVSEAQQGNLIAPVLPKAGLLGGAPAAPKTSKLQALAAARKKKVEATKDAKVEQAEQGISDLQLQEQTFARKENIPPPVSSSPSKRQKLSEPAVAKAQSQATQASKLTDAQQLESLEQPEQHEDDAQTEGLKSDPPAETAPPSAFAQALFGQPTQQNLPPPFLLPSARLSDLPDPFAEPSPDDVVLEAQAKGAAAKKKSSGTSTPKKGADAKTDAKAEAAVAAGVKALGLSDVPLPKSKNLNVIEEYEKSKQKKHASFVVVGHVDAGKSTLMGRLLLDLKVVDQRTVDKFRKEAESIGKSSFHLAWVLDQRPDERDHGVTIDTAMNRFETEKTAFTLLDAPGHRDFVPNMIAGASQADFAILVVDATVGAFEAGLKGQTREHALLLRSLGVSRIIVAVNKLDTVGWSLDRFEEISQQVSGFLSAAHFQAKNIAFVPCSGLNGDNITRRSTASAASWYKGPILIEELEASETSQRALTQPLRMSVSEVYKTTISPITVSGRIDAGTIQTGDAVLIQPSGQKAYIKSLEHNSELIDWAVAGQNIALHLTGPDELSVRGGDMVCSVTDPVPAVETFTAKVLAMGVILPMYLDVHRGRLHDGGQVTRLVALLDKSTGEVTKKNPRIVKAGEVARLVIKLTNKAPLEKGQRVILRSGGETIGAGLLE